MRLTLTLYISPGATWTINICLLVQILGGAFHGNKTYMQYNLCTWYRHWGSKLWSTPVIKPFRKKQHFINPWIASICLLYLPGQPEVLTLSYAGFFREPLWLSWIFEASQNWHLPEGDFIQNLSSCWLYLFLLTCQDFCYQYQGFLNFLSWRTFSQSFWLPRKMHIG